MGGTRFGYATSSKAPTVRHVVTKNRKKLEIRNESVYCKPRSDHHLEGSRDAVLADLAEAKTKDTIEPPTKLTTTPETIKIRVGGLAFSARIIPDGQTCPWRRRC